MSIIKCSQSLEEFFSRRSLFLTLPKLEGFARVLFLLWGGGGRPRPLHFLVCRIFVFSLEVFSPEHELALFFVVPNNSEKHGHLISHPVLVSMKPLLQSQVAIH
jgi:hypothetical protein